MIVNDPAQNHHVYETFLKQRDLDGVMSRFAPDAIVVGPDHSRIAGLDAIRANLAAGLPYMENVSFDLVELVIYGDIALERVNFAATTRLPDGELHEISGASAVVLKRQPDGNWLIAIDDPGM